MARPVDRALTAVSGKAKYQLCAAGAEVHIGGKHDPDDLFLPELHATKPGWNDGTFLRIRHSDAARSQGEKVKRLRTADCRFSIGRLQSNPDAEALEWRIGGRTHHFLQGSLEHAITYASRADAPADGREVYAVDFPAGSLDWHYQPALGAEEIAAGCRQPEHVAGSYAVYGRRSGNLLGRDGTPLAECETGKFCHVYRPQVVAADGRSVWCELRFDARRKQLVVSMPLEFLASAQYPLTLDPEFGYRSNGEHVICTDQVYSLALLKSSCLHAAGAGETLSKLWLYGGTANGSPTCHMAAYTVVSGSPSARGTLVGIVFPGYAAWVEASVGQSLTNGAQYTVAAGDWVDVGDLYYDTGSNGDGCQGSSAALANPFGTPTGDSRLFSMYAEYTIAAGGGPFPHHVRRRLEGGTIGMG